MKNYNDSNKVIIYESGICTLEDFLKIKRIVGKKLNNPSEYKSNCQEIIKYLMNSLCNFVFELSKKNVFHSDIKPSNVMIQENI
jgi:serine/threonine protein kinase